MDEAAEITAGINEAFEEAGREWARRLRQEEGMSYEQIAKRVSLEPAEVYSAVTGKTGAQVETWKRKHGGEGRDPRMIVLQKPPGNSPYEKAPQKRRSMSRQEMAGGRSRRSPATTTPTPTAPRDARSRLLHELAPLEDRARNSTTSTRSAASQQSHCRAARPTGGGLFLAAHGQ